jgi:hypothetical protein
MTPLDIIAAKVSSEGFPVPRELLAAKAVERAADGRDLIIVVDKVVFTVSRDKRPPRVHMYSAGVGMNILSISARFQKELWKRIDSDVVVAPIRNESVAKLAMRFGWKPGETDKLGYTWYFIRR